MVASSAHSKDLNPLNVLCLDGGGVRGLSSLLILRYLLQRLQVESKSETVPLPCEVFDLICGTSTGGLIALMLGRLRMDVEEAIKCYLEFSEKIFGSKLSFSFFRRLRGMPMYSAATLEKCIRDIVAKISGEEDSPLKDPLDGSDRICRTFVVAITRAFADSPAIRFRTYSTKSSPPYACKIWEAARATTAASTFFEAVSIGAPPQTFIDGALGGANNPSRLALDEIDQKFPGRQIGCFLSLGTGVPDVVALKGSLANVARACARLLTSCEGVDDEVRRYFGKQTAEGQTSPYFRFSVNRGLGTITLDEWKRIEELSGVTQGYLRFNDQEERAEKCVKILSQKVEEVQVNAQQEAGDDLV